MNFIVATGNRHKIEEIAAILGPEHRVQSMQELPDPPRLREDGSTFEENAIQKARGLWTWLRARPGLVAGSEETAVMADDSGLEVDALGGAPGVRSARFASEEGATGNSSDAANNAKLMGLMREVPVPDRAARFRCVIAVLRLVPGRGEAEPELYSGTCEGRILAAPSGRDGFGYDPLFAPEGESRSFADLSSELKNRLSHRARALEKLRAGLKQAG